jgi:NTE family protein
LGHWPEPRAFVLSGGGSYGAVQVGMLRALLEAGITPDLVVGSSVGALNGVRYAAGPGDAIDDLTELWLSLDRSGIFGGRTRAGRAWSALRRGLQRNSPSICSPERLRALIDGNISAPLLEDLPVRTAVVVTDALLGQPKVLTQGPVGPILQATSALPGVFPPVKLEGCYYLDGGVTANVPIRQAVNLGARSLVVLNANPPTMPGTVPNSVLGSVFHASKIMVRNQRADADDQLKGRLPILHLPQPTPPEQDSFDFSTAAELIEAGYASTRSFLSELPDLADTTRRLSEAPRPAGGPPPPSPRPRLDPEDGEVASVEPPAPRPVEL